MEDVRLHNVEKGTKEQQLAQAGNMADWFVPFLYGVDIEVGEMSAIVQSRIEEVVGSRETARQLELIRALVNQLPAEHKNNAVLYCVGYPQDAMSVLGDGDIDVTTALLVQAGAQYRPSIEDAQPEVAVTETVPKKRQSSLVRKEHDYRGELAAAGLTAEQIRSRLNAYVATTNSKNYKIVLRSATRFTRWYESGDGVATTAKRELMSKAGFQATIHRLSQIALDASYDSIVHDRGDVISEGLLLPPVLRQSRKKILGEPTKSLKERPLSAEVSEMVITQRTKRVYENMTPVDDDDQDTFLAWQRDALCAQTDPEAFFPDKGGSTRDAKKICTTCDVREQCLDYALRNDERFGIWGGLSERERRKLQTPKSA